MKPFIQAAFQRRLNATGNTTGQHGYVQNRFNALAKESEEDVDNYVATIVTQLAAMTTQSQITAASAAATTTNGNAAITQLAANQQAMMTQLMAYGAANGDQRGSVQRARINAVVPQTTGVHNFNIPAMSTFQQGGRHVGGRGRGGRAPT